MVWREAGERGGDRAFVEESWVLVGHVEQRVWLLRAIWPLRGDAAAVAFSWRRVLTREERRGDVLGWLHTHPPGLLRPSARDERTMRAWRTCLGKPLLCAIGAAGQLAGYVFAGRDGSWRPLERLVRFDSRQLVAVECDDGG